MSHQYIKKVTDIKRATIDQLALQVKYAKWWNLICNTGRAGSSSGLQQPDQELTARFP